MNGLLHRLAARATGSATLLRSDVRAGSRLADGGSGVALAQQEQEGVDVIAPPQRESAGMKVPLPTTQGGQPSTSSVEDIPVQNLSAARPGVHPTAAPVKEPITARSLPNAATAMPSPARQADPGVPQDMPPPLLPLHHAPADAPKQDVTAESFARRAAAPPAYLMPAPAPAAPRSASPAQPSPPPTPATTARESTEVHIHIGRIEVKAVHEPPPPHRKQTPAQAPMSLDAYLAKRGGR